MSPIADFVPLHNTKALSIMKRTILICTVLTIIMGSVSAQTKNPFFEGWKTPFQVPPFEQIRNEHYLPAFQEGMKRQQAEIEAIVKNNQEPTFENTILAFDQSGEFLSRVSAVFYGLNGANTNKEMQEIARQLSPMLSKHSDDINLNPELFKRIRVVYDNRDNSKTDADQKRLVEEIYKSFVRGGANLSDPDKERLRGLNEQISMLQLTFGQNLLAETNAFKLVIDDKKDLEGLPEGLIATAATTGNAEEATRGKWVFTLQNPSVMPFLQFAQSRDLRQKIFEAYINRGNNNNEKDNKAIIAKLIPLRQQKAELMGFGNFAAFALDDRMAKNPENVYKLLDELWRPALSMAKTELNEMHPLIMAAYGDVNLEGWDWRFYSEQLMKEKFDLDEEMLKPYFKLENVRDGIFYVVNKLYGVTFTEVKGAPVYEPSVKLYECKEADGTHLGVLYLDFHPRAGKRGGAWCGSYRPQSYKDGKRVPPISTIVCNFSPPAGDKPALLTADEVETFFHEFGHAMHGLLKNVKYKGLSGVPRDFVELPSQIMEHWAFEPEVLKVYAKHYKTGQIIPSELVEKIVSSSKYGQGFKTTEYLAASYLDMDYHSGNEHAPVIHNDAAAAAAPSMQEAGKSVPDQPLDVLAFEAASMERIGLLQQIPPRYRSTYFQHTMTGGYTAGYYSYIWAEVLDADAYQAFKETGDIFNKELAKKFRTCILEKGGSKDAMEMYVDFRGHEPTIDALLENRGLK